MKHVLRWAAIAIASMSVSLVIGCAGTETYHRSQESTGQIRLDTCDSSECDYKVAVQNTWDFGWDGDDRADRLKAVRLLLGGKCDDLVLVNESVIERGTYAVSNRPARTYVMKLRCPTLSASRSAG